MMVNECISIGERLYSPNGNQRMEMQSDGNLVTYDRNSPIWSSYTYKTKSDRFCLGEKEWVLCDGSKTIAKVFQEVGINHKIILKDNGNLISFTANGLSTWGSKTPQ